MIVFVIIIATIIEFANCQDTLKIKNIYDPETGEIFIQKFDPQTGQLVKKNKSEIKYNQGSNLNYNQIKSLIKINAKNNFKEQNWIIAGMGGCGFGIILGIPGLIIPPLVGYYFFNDIDIKGMPEGITKTQEIMYQKEYIKEIKRLRIKTSFKGNGIGCITTLFLVIGLSN